MKRTLLPGLAPKALALLGLSATMLLGGCFEKEGSCTPQGSTCNTAATVVDLSKTTGCGLALHLADSTYVIPTGDTWTNFHAKAGDKVTVGYTVKAKQTCAAGAASTTCPAGKLVELGCITATTTTTTTSTGAN